MVVKLLTHVRILFALTFVASFALLPLALNPGAASAAPHETPNGLTGAMNMLMAWDTGMEHAMTVDNYHGNEGMFHATCITAGFGCP